MRVRNETERGHVAERGPGNGTLEVAVTPVTVCLVAQHALVLQQLQRVLGESPFQVGTRRVDARLPPHRLAAELPRAQAYVIDVDGPAQEATALPAALLHRFPAARVLAVAEGFSDRLSFDLLRAGAKGVLRYAEVERQLGPALTAVAAGGIWVPRELVSRFLDSIIPTLRKPRLSSEAGLLSQRERQVRDALLENLSNKEIATKLHISERTVKFHVSNLLTKFNVRRRSDLILLALNAPAE
ncbi:MAG: response regulator transcription factor [Myxococcota bacterium]